MTLRRLTPAICLSVLVGGSALAPFAGAVIDAPRRDQAAAVFPAEWSRLEIIRAAATADARLVRFGAAPGVAVLDLTGADPARLRAAGAVVLFDPEIAGACATRPASTSQSRSPS